jgi:hypothetical protein
MRIADRGLGRENGGLPAVLELLAIALLLNSARSNSPPPQVPANILFPQLPFHRWLLVNEIVMRLCSIDFPVIGPDGRAAFQELIPNYIRSFAARQLANEPDYGKCKTLGSSFKFFFHPRSAFNPNPRPAIRNSQEGA